MYRSAFPISGFMIINRLGLNDLIEPINKKLEFQLQDPFLLYRTAKGEISCAVISTNCAKLFYNKRLAQLSLRDRALEAHYTGV